VTGINARFCNLLVRCLATIVLIAALCNLAAPTAAGATDFGGVPRFVPPATSPDSPDRPPSIRFITTDDFPPFSFIDGSGRLTGYNVELARAICTRLQVLCTMQVRAFTRLVDAVNANEADAIIAGLKDTPGLRRYVTHTRAYLRLPARFAMLKDAGINPVPETMVRRRVAVVRGTAHAAFLADFFPGALREETDDLDTALSLLSAGFVEAVFGGGLPLAFWLAGPDGECCAMAGGPYVEPRYFGEGLTIAVRHDNDNLRRVLEDALRALETDGVLADLYLRFFPVGLY
jgi:polar amino acid transport system substrate-binding protein